MSGSRPERGASSVAATTGAPSASVRGPALAFGRAKEMLHVVGDRGEIFAWRLSSTVYASRVQGHLDRRMAQCIIDVGEPLYASGDVSGFHDWFLMTGYESASRIDLTNWVMRHRAHSRLYIGVRSRLVAMGVSVANLALGNVIKAFSEPADLDAALADVLRE